jgi:MFS family permease
MARNPSSRRNLYIGTGEGILAMPWAFISVPGNFILAALLTQFYGLDKISYGLIVSLPAWTNAVQIIVIPWLARFLTPKDLTLGMSWFNIGLWTVLAAALPYLPTGEASGVANLFLIFFLLASVSQSFLGVGWTSWVKDWVPTRLRGQYFGQRNRWLSVSTVLFLLLALALFELNEHALWPYQVLLGMGVAMRCGGLVWQHAIHTPADHLDVLDRSWVSHLRENLASRNLVIFIVFSAWTSFWLGFVGPFIPVFSFEELGFEPGSFSVLVILATVSGIFGWWFWGTQVDRHGCVPVLIAGLFFWEISSYVWVFVSRETVWMLYPLWVVGGFFSTAYIAASFNLLLKLVPPGTKLAGISLHLAVTSIAAAAAPMLAGLLLAHFIEAGTGLLAYRVGFAVKSTAVLAGLLLLRGLREPQRSVRTSLPGAFRTMRQLLAAQGTSFFASMNLQNLRNNPRQPKPRDDA